jgi:hypothetical protein
VRYVISILWDGVVGQRVLGTEGDFYHDQRLCFGFFFWLAVRRKLNLGLPIRSAL